MPKDNGVGYGPTTNDKQQGLKDILSQQLSKVRAIGQKYDSPICYRIMDCCSGTGENPKEMEMRDGSALILIKMVEKFGIRFTGHFIEKNQTSFNQLCHNLGKISPSLKYGRVEAIYGVWEEELFKITNEWAATFPKNKKRYWQFGIAYWDPNSYPDWDVIGQYSNHSQTKNIDILIHCSATSLKRRNGAFPGLAVLLDEYINRINKTDWFIRDILPGDPHQMTFLFGTNYQGYQAMNSKRFYDIHSRMGQRIIDKLSLPREDFMNTSASKEGLDGWGVK